MKKIREKFLILIAEDNQVNLKMMQVMLQDAGYKTASVLSGNDAARSVFILKPDLVLMDIHMPGKDGFSATKEIRALQPPVNNVPIVAVTAQAVPGDKERCLEAGMNDFIAKPVTPQSVVNKLDDILRIGEHQIEEEQPEEQQAAVLDTALLESISLGSKPFIKDLLQTYLEDTQMRLNTLKKSLKEQVLRSIVIEAHSIKGASLSVGANKVGKEAHSIELAGKSNDFGAATEKFSSLNAAFIEVKSQIIDYLEKL